MMKKIGAFFEYISDAIKKKGSNGIMPFMEAINKNSLILLLSALCIFFLIWNFFSGSMDKKVYLLFFSAFLIGFFFSTLLFANNKTIAGSGGMKAIEKENDVKQINSAFKSSTTDSVSFLDLWKKSKLSGLLVVLVAILVFIVIFSASYAPAAKIESKSTDNSCSEMPEGSEKDECFYLASLKTGACFCSSTNIKDQGMRDLCFRDYALKTGNGEMCMNIYVDSKQDECFSSFAKKYDEGEWCSKIIDSSSKEDCMKIFKGN